LRQKQALAFAAAWTALVISEEGLVGQAARVDPRRDERSEAALYDFGRTMTG